MKKRWKVWFLFVLVLVLFVSFSLSVCASGVDQAEDAFLFGDSEFSEILEEAYVDQYGVMSASPRTSGTYEPYTVVISQQSVRTNHIFSSSSSVPIGSAYSLNSTPYTVVQGYFLYTLPTSWVLTSSVDKGYNFFDFSFAQPPTVSIDLFSYSQSSEYYTLQQPSNGYFAFGPALFSSYSASDMSRFHRLRTNTVRQSIPLTDVDHQWYFRLWYIQPFIFISNTYDFYYVQSLKPPLTVDYTVSLNQLVRYASGSATSQDIKDQTEQLNQATKEQTDTLVNGYDNSDMNSSNDKLASSMSSYDGAESQVTDQSVEYIDAVTFFDPTTHLQLMTSVTYVSTFLQNLFVVLGDWSVLITIALSIAFALMLIGWFKYRK